MARLDPQQLSRVRSQMSRGEIILFTGAGFSCSAQDRAHRSLPTARQLKEELHELCYPGAPIDDQATLGDLYDVALRRHRKKLERFLEQRLSVDTASLPDFYRTIFDQPWLRVYTLNVDDLAHAIARHFQLPRPLNVISATVRDDPRAPVAHAPADALEVVHLNGTLPGPAESLTFSETQYAERLARQEPWYARCASDLLTRAAIFIGAELHESTLFQHMEFRRTQGTRGHQPTSILISPHLSASRVDVLQDLRIEWVAGTAESFATDTLPLLADAARSGFAYITAVDWTRGTATVPLVSDLAAKHPTLDTEYLIGQQPVWADLLTGRAAHRDDDDGLLELSKRVLNGKTPATAIAITGTAGTGKSTALMRLALAISNAGIPVYWVDQESEAPISRILNTIRGTTGPIALAIDDADLFGRQFAGLLRDLIPTRNDLLVMFAARSNRIDFLADMITSSGEISLEEHTIPPLSDGDIDRIIATLDRHNRLGILKGKSDSERRRTFRDLADRQILVAMYKATTGEEFEQKVQDEATQLTGALRSVYSLLCVATAQRQYLTRDEVLLALGDEAASGIDALDRLVARHMVVASPPAYRYTARHRVVADFVLTKLQEIGELKDVLIRLAFVAGSKVTPAEDRQGRMWRLLKRIMSHDLLRRLIGVIGARELYETVENLLSFDYHYWLQRGSLEVEIGDLRLAEQFLDQARSLAADDYRVQTEYAYLLMRKGIDRPANPDAERLVMRGMEALEEAILFRGKTDPYPFHVLGSQGLAWLHRTAVDPVQKRRLLDRLLHATEQGVQLHPRDRDLLQLRDDIRREVLLTAVPSKSP
jgi:hypothetical protein